jgi:hypothetical protein
MTTVNKINFLPSSEGLRRAATERPRVKAEK